MTRETELAEARSRTARARMLATLGQLQARLAPEAVAHDAVEIAKEQAAALALKGIEEVRRRPKLVAAVAAGVGLFAARRPLGAIVWGLAQRALATPAGRKSLTGGRAKRPRKGPSK